MKTTAFYCRVSDREKNAHAMEFQKKRISDYIEKNNIDVGTIHVYEDIGSGNTLNRSELNKLLLAIRENQFDMVAIADASRLAQFTNDYIELTEFFEKHSVKLIICKNEKATLIKL